MTEIAAVLLLIGTIFCTLASVGLLRFPDVYTRLHAASKAGPLGAGLVLLAVAVASADLAIAIKAILGLVFLLATAPLAAHLLARAALKSGTPLSNNSSINEYDDSR